MTEQLLINDNAYFYKQIRPIPANKISQIFTEVSRKKLSNRFSLREIKRIASVGSENFYYSICIFKYNHKPSFLREPISEWFEIKFSFLLIIEYSNHIVVYKKNVAGLRSLEEFIQPLDYETISRLYLNEETRYEKFYVSNMSTADNALRNKTIEANNLQGTISRIGAPKQIIHNMRVANDNERISLSLNTSRINNLTDRSSLQNFFAWTVSVIRRINAFNWRDTYLDNFAYPIKFENHINDLEPICILIKFDKLLDDIEREQIERVYKVDDDGDEIADFELNSFIDLFKNTLNINRLENGTFIVENPVETQMEISKATKSLRINSSEFKKILIQKDENDVTNLNSFINSRSDFIINFSDPQIIYAYRKLFKDHKLLADIDGFLSVFEPHDELVNTTSEKGNFTNDQTRFNADSIFGFIQDTLASDSLVLFCDDLGNEWADFIAIKQDSIVFYHAKHKAGQGISASDLQDVIGQAHKNLGNLEPTDEMLTRKADNKWSTLYNSGDSIQTNINRMVIGLNNSLDDSIQRYKLALAQPNVKKQVNLVIDFISKDELRNGLQSLVNNQPFARRNEVTQILWFVSSLTANCKEIGIETYISCRP